MIISCRHATATPGRILKKCHSLATLPDSGAQQTLLCTDKVYLPKELILVIALYKCSYKNQSPYIHRGSDGYNSPRKPKWPLIGTCITSTHHHIKIWHFKQLFIFTFAVCKATAETCLQWISLHIQSHSVLPGHSVTAGDTRASSLGPGTPLPSSTFSSPQCIHAWNPPRIPISLLSVKLIQNQTRREQINAAKKPTSNIGLHFQKQPSIFRATAFKSSAWDILTAFSMNVEYFQLPWKLANEVGAQHFKQVMAVLLQRKNVKPESPTIRRCYSIFETMQKNKVLEVEKKRKKN